MFKIGEHVVHPLYGVGRVVNSDVREFEPGKTQPYYEIAITGGGTVWVPLDSKTSGLRGLTVRSEIDHCRAILASHPLPLAEEARFRQSELVVRLKQGTIAAHCEVVRDLYGFGAHRSLNGTIAAFFRATQDVLCQEWAAVEGITLPEALQEIGVLLEESRRTLGESKA